MIVRKSWHFFYTSKPYSYASEVSRGLAFYVALAPAATYTGIATAAFQTLTMWLYFNWQSDRIQGDPGRTRPKLALVGLPVLVSMVLGFWQGGPWGVAGVAVYIVCIRLYSMKARSPSVGSFGPLLRAGTVCGHFVMIWSLTTTSPDGQVWLMVAAFAIWKGVRNLIGDVRDVRTDMYEIPTRFGVLAAMWAIRLGTLSAIVVLSASGVAGSGLGVGIMIASWAMLEWLKTRFVVTEAYKWGYLAHRAYVLTGVALHLAVGVSFGLPAGWAYSLAVLALVLHPCYDRLPGKCFPPWRGLVFIKPSTR